MVYGVASSKFGGINQLWQGVTQEQKSCCHTHLQMHRHTPTGTNTITFHSSIDRHVLCIGLPQLHCKHMYVIIYPLTYLEPYYTTCIHTIFHMIMGGRCTMLTSMTSTIWGDKQKKKNMPTLHAHPRNLYTHILHFSGSTLPYNFHWHNVHFSNATEHPYNFYPNNFHLFGPDTQVQWTLVAKALHSHTYTLPDTSSSRCTLFHSPEWLHSLWFNGHFVACNSILSHPLVPSGEITGSGLIHKTHRTTLESLLQFELSNHNGRMRLPFFPRCVYVWVNVYMAGS